MNRRTLLGLLSLAALYIVLANPIFPWLGSGPFAVAEDEEPDAISAPPPTTVIEARARAVILHETIHGALQVMHRDFFDEENAGVIPSQSLDDVFRELDRSHGIQLRWLVVETDVVNIDHQPQDDFERAAVEQLAAGRANHEAIEENTYRFAGAIRLGSQCLKCHVKRRTSTEDRTAGLVIQMPLRVEPQ